MLDKHLLNEWFAIPPEELEARSPIPLRILAVQGGRPPRLRGDDVRGDAERARGRSRARP